MKFISQSVQAGNYWLIMVTLTTDDTLPFGYKVIVDANEWVLFSQTKKSASFLSYAKYQNIKDNSISFLQNNPANLILSTEKTYLLLASDLNMASAFYLLKELRNKYKFIVILSATNNFPFIVKPAQFMFTGFPAHAIGSCPLLEDWKVVNRLCSNQGLPGCFDGDIAQLFIHWTPAKDWEILKFE